MRITTFSPAMVGVVEMRKSTTRVGVFTAVRPSCRRLLSAAQLRVQREVLFFLDHLLDGIERISRRDLRADFGKRCVFAAVYRVYLFFVGVDLGVQRLLVLSLHESQF